MEMGFHRAVLNKNKHGILEVMIQFTNHTMLITACRNFNSLNKGFCFEPKKYYCFEKNKISTKEFKIVSVKKTISN